MVEIIKNNKIVTLSDGDVHLSFKMRQSVAEIISHSENISDLIPLFDLFVKKYSPLSVRIYLTSDSHLPKEEDLFYPPPWFQENSLWSQERQEVGVRYMAEKRFVRGVVLMHIYKKKEQGGVQVSCRGAWF